MNVHLPLVAAIARALFPSARPMTPLWATLGVLLSGPALAAQPAQTPRPPVQQVQAPAGATSAAAPAATATTSQPGAPTSGTSTGTSPAGARIIELGTINVVATTPLMGVGVGLDLIPYDVQSFSAKDISRQGSPSLLSTLEDQVGSVNTNDNLVDRYQPSLNYRGFAGSPVLGQPEGLAVYQNGVRINEAFGNTVNWDLVPSLAIERMQVSGSNPVYGLNALGGSVAVTMKNGYTYNGFGAELGGGSYRAHQESAEFGSHNDDGYSIYVAANASGGGNWRFGGKDQVRQMYLDLGKRWSRGELHITYTGDRNRLFGEGTTPEQTLAINRSLDFTTPQENDNRLNFVTASGSYDATDHILLQAQAYLREFNQSVANGNVTDYVPCAQDASIMCHSADGTTPLLQANGQEIPNLAIDPDTQAMGENDGELIHTVTKGGTLQATDTQDLFGHRNNFVVGVSLDDSNVDFSTFAQLGLLSPQLVVLPSPYLVDTPEDVADAGGFTAVPVGLRANIKSWGAYFTDTFSITDALAVTASGRYNHIAEDLHDQLGTDLTGNNTFTRFNPAFGVTYTFSPRVTAYAGYAEGNRAPTPGEIECSDPSSPCLLPSSLSGDPPILKQVVSRTVEVGLRGNVRGAGFGDGVLNWNVGLFRANVSNPIYLEQVTPSTAFDVNLGSTRNRGLEANLSYQTQRLDVFASYSFVQAQFTSPFVESSPSNPYADANSDILVQSGDRQPGIPENQLKLGANYLVTPKWAVGAVVNYYSSQYLLGDESNQNKPLPGYAVLNLNTSYRVAPHVTLFANLSNVLNRHYNTFGEYSDATGAFAPGVIDDVAGTQSRFYGPAAPFEIFGGVKVRFAPPAAPPPPPAAPPPPLPVAPPPPPPQNVVIDLRGVNFKFDRPQPGEHNIGPALKPPASASLAILSQAVDTLNRYPQVQIQIDGYTDSIGKPAYNQKLSERRASIVDAYLTSHGIAPSRITAVQGFGENDPVDTNKTAAGRQRNRRVEFKVEGQGVTNGADPQG